MTHTLVDIERAIRPSWGADTTCLAPGSLPTWSPDNPAHGQCGPTALVVQDLLGGELLIADVSGGDELNEVHYWNRLQGGLEVDLTRDQFACDQVVGEPRVVVRPPTGPRIHVEEYQLLHRRVSTELNLVRHVELRGQLVCRNQAEAAIVSALLPRHLELTHAEEGCISFAVTSSDAPGVWDVYERFRDADSFERHQERVKASQWGIKTAGIERNYAVTGL